MLKLPTCPYCEARYNYKDIKQIYKNKSECCHNCKKSFNISYLKGRIILIIIAIIIFSIINVISYNIFVNINIWINLACTIGLVTGLTTLFPYTVRFLKSDKNNKTKNNSNYKNKK